MLLLWLAGMQVMAMDKVLELKLCKPIYSTYHVQGNGGAVLYDNPSVFNWYYNEAANLSCSKRFMEGYSSPELTVPMSAWYENPHIEQKWFSMKELKAHTNTVIKELISQGYYVNFYGVDDYYVKGKSWYGKRHYEHDGLIHGYDQTDKSFSIYAYDEQFVYRSFKTGQLDFDRARESMFEQGVYGHICGIKPEESHVYIDPHRVYESVKEYIDGAIPSRGKVKEDNIYGIEVLKYILIYLTKLLDGSIMHQKLDWRICRLLWEHSCVMQDRIRLVTGLLRTKVSFAENYSSVVKAADTARILYASYHIKQRDSVLKQVINNVDYMYSEEINILTQFIDMLGGVIGI